MGEVAGLVIGAIGLVSLGNTVEDLFKKVTIWKELDKDYQQYRLELDMASIAFRRWHNSVQLVDRVNDVHSETRVASESDANTVFKLLQEIKEAFKEAEKYSQRYDAETTGQRGVTVLQKARWLVRDSDALKKLAKQVSKNVEGLVRLFPGLNVQCPQQDDVASLQANEAVPSTNNNELVLLPQQRSNSSSGVDYVVEQADGSKAERTGQGHTFSGNIVRGRGVAGYGDQYPKPEDKPLSKTGHIYRVNIVEEGGTAMFGDRINMPDPLSRRDRD